MCVIYQYLTRCPRLLISPFVYEPYYYHISSPMVISGIYKYQQTTFTTNHFAVPFI